MDNVLVLDLNYCKTDILTSQEIVKLANHLDSLGIKITACHRESIEVTHPNIKNTMYIVLNPNSFESLCMPIQGG